MSQSNPMRVDRVVRQHLESLQAAGVTWLPVGGPVAELTPAPMVESSESQATASKLVEDSEPMRHSTVDQRRIELGVLAERVSQCTRCAHLAEMRTQTVFGVGKLDPELCFVGEAPGADEDRQGEPFVGAAGKLLDKIIVACGMKREEVYICNIIRCRPPENRTPLPQEAANCREYLEGTLELVRPKYICALGACAAQNLLQTTQGIGRLRGQFHNYKGIPVLCTYHPAYLLRNPSAKREVWEDMKKLLREMGRPIPNS